MDPAEFLSNYAFINLTFVISPQKTMISRKDIIDVKFEVKGDKIPVHLICKDYEMHFDMRDVVVATKVVNEPKVKKKRRR